MSADDIFKLGVEEHLEAVEDALRVAFEDGCALCDSEIEKKLLAALMFIAPGWHDVAPIPNRVIHPGQRDQIVIYPQQPVGKYRVDFAVIAEFGAVIPPVRIAVECDGHDFHEKTKEQAARDKRRDREIAIAGYTVMRFTGSEIHRDARGCAQQVADLIFEKISNGIEHHLKQGGAS